MRNDTFLKACRGEPASHTPVWMMRQAGRYMKEYREIREKYSFLEVCENPELAGEVTMQPVNKLGVDAAILFCDILIPCRAMGMNLEFVSGKGPVFDNPVRNKDHVDRLNIPDPMDETGYVMKAVELLSRELKNNVPLIGFAGGPFTLASYMIEGGSSKSFSWLFSMMYRDPDLFHGLMEKITETVIDYMEAQIDSGARAVQLFDTWAGLLPESDYREFAYPYSKEIISSLKTKEVPVIHFIKGTSHLLEPMIETEPDVISVDWKIPLSAVRSETGSEIAVQGNLNPGALFGSREILKGKIEAVLEEAGPEPGHIFNLGHGINKETDPDKAKFLVETVHRLTSKR